MHINERPSSTWGRGQEFEQGLSNHSNRSSSTKWRNVDCSACTLPSCNVDSIILKTLRINISVEIIIWRKRIHNINSVCHFGMSLSCALFSWPLSCIQCCWPLPLYWSSFLLELLRLAVSYFCFHFLSILHCVSPHLFLLPLKYYCPLGSILSFLFISCPLSSISMAEMTCAWLLIHPLKVLTQLYALAGRGCWMLRDAQPSYPWHLH